VGEDISCGCAYIVDGRCYWCGALESRLGAIDAMLEERQRAREQRERETRLDEHIACARTLIRAHWLARTDTPGQAGYARRLGFGVLVPHIIVRRTRLCAADRVCLQDWMFSGTRAGEHTGPFLALAMFRALCEYSAGTIASCWPAPR
jgi:hypothetical protein